jgi:D-proline reductase (dithiol) PrdB
MQNTVLDPEDFRAQYEKWVQFVADNHHGQNNRVNVDAAFTPLRKPLAEARVALVTSAGVHLADQEPFHTATVAGDATYRVIPNDVDFSTVRFAHTHYDTSSAEQDLNVVLPITRLAELVERGRVGAASPVHIGMMGFNPDPSAIADTTGPAVAAALTDADVDVAIFAPG